MFRNVHHRINLGAISIGLLGLTSANALAGDRYSWTEIVIPNAMVTSAFGPNNLGQIAVIDSNGNTGIYRRGRITSLPAPPAGFHVGAYGINDAGVIVGFATTTGDAHEQGFMLVHGQYRFFSRAGWPNTEARSIGPTGLIVGINFTDDQSQWAGFLYDPSTAAFTDVTPSASVYTIAQGINRFGRISGSGQDDLGRYAFIWQLGPSGSSGELVPFLERIRLADGFANARGINDHGVIVGWAHSNAQTVGFIGGASRGYQLLIPPGGDAAGASSYCQGINNAREVGCIVIDAAGSSRGFFGAPQDDD